MRDAAALTDHALTLDAYERKAWQVLGYASWREYAKTEFSMGQSHAYRLLDQGRVIRALEEAAGISPMGEIVSRPDPTTTIPPQAVITAAAIKAWNDSVDENFDPARGRR